MLALARDPGRRIRDLALDVGITERAVQRILVELVEAGAIASERLGRRNHYKLNWELPMRHPLERTHTVGELLQTLAPQRLPEPPVEDVSLASPAELGRGDVRTG